MKIDDISITKSTVMQGSWVLAIESRGYKFLGYFDNLLGFMNACSDAMKYLGQAHGAIKIDKDGTVTSTKV